MILSHPFAVPYPTFRKETRCALLTVVSSSLATINSKIKQQINIVTLNDHHHCQLTLKPSVTHCNTLQYCMWLFEFDRHSFPSQFFGPSRWFVKKTIRSLFTYDSAIPGKKTKRRGFPGFAKVNQVTSASLGYPLSVSNNSATLKRSNMRDLSCEETK